MNHSTSFYLPYFSRFRQQQTPSPATLLYGTSVGCDSTGSGTRTLPSYHSGRKLTTFPTTHLCGVTVSAAPTLASTSVGSQVTAGHCGAEVHPVPVDRWRQQTLHHNRREAEVRRRRFPATRTASFRSCYASVMKLHYL